MTKEFFIGEKSTHFQIFKALVEDKKVRQNERKAIVFGKKICLEFHDRLQALITTQEGKDHPAFITKDRYILDEKTFRRLSKLITPEPYAGIISLPSPLNLPVIKKGLLIGDGINDPGNLGTLFRTAFGFGLDGIILTPGSVDPYHEKVLRASKGLSLKLPWLELETDLLTKRLKDWQLDVYRAELNGTLLYEITPKTPFALILGNESQGISEDLKGLGKAVHIPQATLESLNVAVAGAIISYSFLYGGPHVR